MYEFTLKLNINEFAENVANRLFKGGCDDTLFNSDSTGIYLDFCRKSTSLEAAISSALADVKKAGYEAEIYYTRGI